MKIKIENKHDNPLLQRQDVTFQVDHAGTATPARSDVRAKLAAMLNCKEDQLFIVKLNGLYGQSVSEGYAHLYSSKEDALKLEQAHIINRHTTEEAAPAAPTMKPEEVVPKETKEETDEAPKEEVKESPKEVSPKKKEEEKPSEKKKPDKKEEPPKPQKAPKKEEPKTSPKEKAEPKKEKPAKGKPKKEDKPSEEKDAS